MTSHLISTAGADILAVFLFAAGLILVTGATLAGILRATGAGVAGTTRALRRSTSGMATTRRTPARDRKRRRPGWRARRRSTSRADERRAAASTGARHVRARGPGDPRRGAAADRHRRRRRARVRAAGSRRRLRAIRGTGRRAARSHAREPHAAGPLPRQRHRRPELRMARPEVPFPGPLDRRGGQARHRRPGAGGGDAARDARPLRDRGEGDRPGHRPAHHPLRAPAGARDQGLQGGAAQGRPRVRAGRDRDPDPRADPGQAGRRGRGPERAPADRAPRRRVPGSARRTGRR